MPPDGRETEFEAVPRVDTPQEAEYFRNGGILPFVLRQLAAVALTRLSRDVYFSSFIDFADSIATATVVSSGLRNRREWFRCRR